MSARSFAELEDDLCPECDSDRIACKGQRFQCKDCRCEWVDGDTIVPMDQDLNDDSGKDADQE